MPVNPALAITIPASSPRYRITAISFHRPNPVHHKNLDLNPYTVEFRLVTRAPVVPFSNHLTQVLDFTDGEVQFVSGTPPGLVGYAGWTTVSFNH